MKSNLIKIKDGDNSLAAILDEAENVCNYNKLETKQALHLRLLCEEMVCMLPELLNFSTGEFYIINDGLKYEIHCKLKSESRSDIDREQLIDCSKKKKNTVKGVLNKIQNVVAVYLDNSEMAFECGYTPMPYTDGMSVGVSQMNGMWSLGQYVDDIEEKTEEWDEIEKSIIAKVADDIIVSVVNKKVEILIIKDFSK